MIDTYVFSGIEDAARVRSIADLDDCSGSDYERDVEAARHESYEIDSSEIEATDDPAVLAANALTDRYGSWTACDVWRTLRAYELIVERLS